MRSPLARTALAPVLIGAILSAALLPAAERPPIADFAKTPEMRNMSISPDGQSLAFLNDFSGRTYLCVLDLAGGKTYRFKVGEANYNGAPMPKEVDRFWWVGSKRLVFVTTLWGYIYGAAAVDFDGRHWRGLTGHEFDPTGRLASPVFELIHVFRDGDPRILMLDRKSSLGSSRLYPDVLEVNTATGGSKQLVKNPGNVVGWLGDDEGVVRIGLARDKENSWVMYRETAAASWRTLPLPSRGHDKLRPLGFDPLDGSFYVAGFNKEDRWTVFPFDLSSGALGEPIVSDPVYDALGGGFNPTFNGVALSRLIFSEASQKLIGVTYVTEVPRVKWLDPEFARIQTAVNRSLKDTVNLLVNKSRDDNRILFLSFSDRDPGTYHLLDRAAKSFNPIGSCREWIKPSQMSPMLSINFAARDGETIRGYLTVPVGHEPRELPTVVLPHGGPWVRDVWGFDPIVQLIASRGYAVLQVNYRGSRGYGSAFEMLGKRQIGGAIQDDIEDATRWAIATGVADEKRMAICGASYGGYSALFALGHSPELYRCGISIAGVTDWLEILDRGGRDPVMVYARQRWVDQIGDPEDDEARLRAMSPVNFADKITAPTLIIQARDDRTVPQRQAKKMESALRDAGHPAEVLYLKEGGHSLSSQRERTEAFTAAVEFLEKYLGPGVDFRPKP